MNTANDIHDLLIVGAGINGAGIARDAAGRGLSVALCDKGDIAGATSWASSKLIHGGLRYLEHYDFALVRESLQEREVILRIAPHLTNAIRFVMPHTPALRPAWMIRIGLWLYDHLGGSLSLPKSDCIPLGNGQYGAPLNSIYKKGFIYSDVQVDDARLTLANVRDAVNAGASFMPRTRMISARRENSLWVCSLAQADGTPVESRCRALINAAGPWAAQLHPLLGGQQKIGIQLVRGSHIVVPRLYQGDHAYTLQNDDGRVVFILPFFGQFSMVGTTEVRMDSPDMSPAASDEEIDYLCRAANRYLHKAIAPSDILWRYAGVRPLLDDGKADRQTSTSQVSREYQFMLDQPTTGDAPLLTIIGGKLTTYRRLAEKALARLASTFPHMGPTWTAEKPLPDREIDQNASPGIDFGGGLCERDVRYFLAHEWAQDAEDILWRRTKAGLLMTREQRDMFATWLEANRCAM